MVLNKKTNKRSLKNLNCLTNSGRVWWSLGERQIHNLEASSSQALLSGQDSSQLAKWQKANVRDCQIKEKPDTHVTFGQKTILLAHHHWMTLLSGAIYSKRLPKLLMWLIESKKLSLLYKQLSFLAFNQQTFHALSTIDLCTRPNGKLNVAPAKPRVMVWADDAH